MANPDTVTVFSDTPTLIDVLANDSDPEGGALTLVSASATTGTAVVQAGQVLYTSPVGFAGGATITYGIADSQGATATGTVAMTVLTPTLTATSNAEGTLTIEAETGVITINVTAPAELAGTYETDTSLLAGGPVNLVPPRILGNAGVGDQLSVDPGLWVHTGSAPVSALQWRRNGFAVAGATSATYNISTADAGTDLTAAETLTDPAGSRTATSQALGVASDFAPVDDAGVIAWYDAATPSTITASGGFVSNWASRVGSLSLAQGESSSRPTSGARSIGGLNVLDFDGTDRLVGAVVVPMSGNVAVHAVVAIDSVTSAFAALLAMRGTARDFQIDANNAAQFDGRLNLAGIGSTVALGGGPFSGTRLISVVFDQTGSGTIAVFVDGVQRASTPYTIALDAGQVLQLMTNRSQNAFVDGAVGEVIVTGSVTNRAEYQAYLAAKWGIL